MKSFFLALALAASSFAQTSPFPGAFDSNGTLAVAADNVQSALTAPMQISDTTAQVANATRIPQWSLITFGAEILKVCLKSGNTLTFGTPDACPSIAGRGLSGTTVVPHSAGVVGHLNIDAYHQQALATAIMAIEGSIPRMVADSTYKAAGNTLYQACAAAVNAGLQLAVASAWTGVSAGSCGAPITFYKGGSIQPASGQTVTFTLLSAQATTICDISLGGACTVLPADGTLHPEWWGMVANGQLGGSAHNDTAAFQAAVNEAKVTGYAIDLPPGIIKITQPVDLRQNISCNFQILASPPVASGGDAQACGIEIHGKGIGKTTIWQSQPATDGLTAIAGGVAQFPSLRLEGFSVYGPDGGTCPGASGNGIYISGLQKVSITSVYANGFCGAGKAGIWLDKVEGFLVKDSRGDNSDSGVKLTGFANDGTMINVKANYNYTAGFNFEDVDSGSYISLSAQSNQCDGARLSDLKGVVFTALYVENNNIIGGCYGLNGVNALQNNQFLGLTLETHRDVMRLDAGIGFGNMSKRNHFFDGAGPDGNQGMVILNNANAAGNYWENYVTGLFENISTGTAGNGATSMTVSSYSPAYVGEVVTGTGLQANTIVTAASGAYSGVNWLGTITLSLPTTAPISGVVTFAGAGGHGGEIFIGQSAAGGVPFVSFIPVLVFGDGNTPGGCTQPTYGAAEGSYLNSGGMISVYANVALIDKGTCTGTAYITGIPANVVVPAPIGSAYVVNLAATEPGIVSMINGYNAPVYLQTSNGQGGPLGDTHFTNSTVVHVSMTYY